MTFSVSQLSTVETLLRDAARREIIPRFRNLADGSVRVFRGIPSRPGEALQRGQLATGQLQFKVKGFALRGAA